jgi:DNA invertase Pin-like site-specific DNA recombinase
VTTQRTTPTTSTRKAINYVAYYRVSTQRQGTSGLGLEAQRDAVERYVAGVEGHVLAAHTETESGKKASNRPELQLALELCRKKRAVLLIAKLDRLARNVHFISGLLETGIEFVAVDAPSKDRFMLHLVAAFAEEEARRISIRTREALAAAKRRGVVIGATGAILAKAHNEAAMKKAEVYRPVITELRGSGVWSVKSVRDRLNTAGVPSPGGGRWHVPNTYRLCKRLGYSFP